MTEANYILILLICLVASVVFNVVLLIRIDIIKKFMTYLKYLIAMLYIDLEKYKNELNTTKSSEHIEKTFSTNQENSGSGD
jgi:hypothetical protein